MVFKLNLEKTESWAKVVAGFSVPVLGALVTLVVSCQEQRNREIETKLAREGQQAQVFAQIMSNRERADSEIRAQMFQTLLQDYLKSTRKLGDGASSEGQRNDTETPAAGGSQLADIEQEVLLLELLLKNFEEYFNTRPLFEDLDRRLGRLVEASEQDSEEASKPEADGTTTPASLRNRLRKIASRTAKRQEALLSRVGSTRNLIFEEEQTRCFTLYPPAERFRLVIEPDDNVLRPMLPLEEYTSCELGWTLRAVVPLPWESLPEEWRKCERRSLAVVESSEATDTPSEGEELDKCKELEEQPLSYDYQTGELYISGPIAEDTLKHLDFESSEETFQEAVEILEEKSEEFLELRLAESEEIEYEDAGTYSIQVNVKNISSESAEVEIRIFKDNYEIKEEAGEVIKVLKYSKNIRGSDRKPIRFSVSFYDLPFMDNTRLYEGARFAVVLRGISERTEGSGEISEESSSPIKQVELGFITFSDDYMSVRDRPYFTQMLRELKSVK